MTKTKTKEMPPRLEFEICLQTGIECYVYGLDNFHAGNGNLPVYGRPKLLIRIQLESVRDVQTIQ